MLRLNTSQYRQNLRVNELRTSYSCRLAVLRALNHGRGRTRINTTVLAEPEPAKNGQVLRVLEQKVLVNLPTLRNVRNL